MLAADLFKTVGLEQTGQAPWGEPLRESRPGVYVVTRGSGEVVYVGRTTASLAKRLGQFYRHQYGAKSPHRGGQDVLLLKEPLSVHWAVTSNPHSAESKMLKAFKATEHRLPFANKVRGARVKARRIDVPSIGAGFDVWHEGRLVHRHRR